MKKEYLFLLLLLIICVLKIDAQNDICTGNLGDNIFTSGDFSSGQANILPSKPMDISTTYDYVGQGPPRDGSFTITNNTGAWSGLFSAWLAIGDRSDDPNGYFMVINADFTPGIIYEQTIEGLCENTLYAFSADIINLVKIGTLNHTEPNVSFLLNEEEQYTTGDIGQTERWNTYGFTFTTDPGVTTMKLSLRNNAPGGSGNDLAIDNVTFRPCGPIAEILPKDIANICEDGDPITINATINGGQFGEGAFQWQQSFDEGLNWQDIDMANQNTIEHTEKSAGFYYYRYLLSNTAENLNNAKCRVNSNTKIVQVVPKLFDIERAICEGLSFEVGASSYNQSGVYTDSLISSLGCDSIVTLDLTIVPDEGIDPMIRFEHPICAGDTEGTISISNIQNINPPFTITVGERQATSFVQFVELTAGIYDILIEDAVGCTFGETIELIDPAPFVIDLGGNLRIDLGESVTIAPSTNFPITQFQWSPNQADCVDNCSESTFLPTTSSTYSLTATSELGCLAIDSVFIAVNPVRRAFIPNVFSPNADGTNDFFAIHTGIPNVQEILQVAIYDRWGTLLFERQNVTPNQGSTLWDGTYQGQQVEQGVYLYHTNIMYLDGEKERITGTVTVVY